MQRLNSQSEIPEEGAVASALPESRFIASSVEVQQPEVQSTALREANVQRKGQIIALAKLKDAAENHEIM